MWLSLPYVCSRQQQSAGLVQLRGAFCGICGLQKKKTCVACGVNVYSVVCSEGFLQ